MARGSFDEEVRTAMRGRGNVNRGDAQQEARDRVARRRNVQSGKNPNPRTSTAYKEAPPARAKKSKTKSSGGGKRKGVPTPGVRPPNPSNTPDTGPIPGVKPGSDLPVVDSPNPLTYLLPILLSRYAAGMGERAGKEKGINYNDPRLRDPKPMSGVELPSQDLMVRRPGTDVDAYRRGDPMVNAESEEVRPRPPLPALNAPDAPPQLTYQPAPGGQQALPPPSGDASELERNASRFLTESEIADMQTRMPGVIKSPGWGPRKPPMTFPHKLVR